MTDLINRIVAAIIRQEGESPNSCNPGNLRTAPWMGNPQTFNGFWVAPSRAAGIAGIAHIVALHIAEGDTLEQFIRKYAPGCDHNATEAYIQHVLDWAQIPKRDEPMWNYLV